MTMAKGIANGSPLGAAVATSEVADKMEGLMISTFGGNPVSCAASLATIKVMEEEASPQLVEEAGTLLRLGLEALKEKYPVIGDVRGKGLIQGLEMVRDRNTKEPATREVGHLFEATRQRGLLIGKGGLYGNTVRVTPPLIARKDDIEEALSILDHAFAEVQETL